MPAIDWTPYRALVRQSVRDQLAETDFRVWVGEPSQRTRFAIRLIQANESPMPYALADLVRPGDRDALLLVAEAGAGKTTLALDLVAQEIETDKPPLFLQIGLWDGSSDLLKLTSLQANSEWLQSFSEGDHLVVIDAIDEVEADHLDSACEKILSFIQGSFRNNRFVLTARSGEIPRWFTTLFRVADVLPMELTEVNRHLSPVLHAKSRLMPRDEMTRLQGLCRNPLVLAMTLRVLSLDVEQVVGDFMSRSDLYQQFLRSIEQREEFKRSSAHITRRVSEIRTAVLRRVAVEMQLRGILFADRVEIEEWLSSAVEEVDTHHAGSVLAGHSGRELFELIEGQPPLKCVRAGLDQQRYGFLHATFRDVYAAQYLLRASIATPPTFQLTDAVLDTKRTLWPAIVHMAGLAPNPTEIAAVVMNSAVQYERADLFILASECVSNRWDASRAIADTLWIRILDAFKNWGDAFNYDLVRAAEALLPLTSRRLPERLKNDLRYCISKYARFVPSILEGTRTPVLLGMLDSPEPADVCNAAHTLLDRFDPDDPASDSLIRKLHACLGRDVEVIRQEILVVLLEVSKKDEGSGELFRQIFLAHLGVPDLSAIERVYSLAGLATCAKVEDFGLYVDALNDRSNPYRDSTSWSLQMFLQRLRKRAPGLVEEGLRFYVTCLQSEGADPASCYAKGNIIYSIGSLGGLQFRSVIEEFMVHETDPFVLEDAVNCLGLLGSAESFEPIVSMISHPDAGVRMKAAEALGRIGDARAIPILLSTSLDTFAVVREAAQAALVVLRPGDRDSSVQFPRVDRSWIESLLERATRRNTETQRLEAITEREVAILKSAVNGLHDPEISDLGLEVRGTRDRYEVIMRNRLYVSLKEFYG